MDGVDSFYEWYKHNQQEIKEKKKKKRSKNQYFTDVTQNAIIAFNNETNQIKRNKVFSEFINYPLNKLVENVYNALGPFKYIDIPYEDIKAEVVSFLTEKLDRYNESSGKAYSYFSIVARNYLIIRNKNAYKKLTSAAETYDIDADRDLINEIHNKESQDNLKHFVDTWVEQYDSKLPYIFSNDKDLKVADAILDIFRMRESIDVFKKKALNIMIREKTQLKTANITRVVNVMKKDFKDDFETYLTQL